MVYIVGIGPGNKDYIIPKVLKVIENCKIVIGFERALKSINFINADKVKVNKLNQILEILNQKEYENICIAASGDPLFYGISDYIKKNYNGEIEIIPGISSFQYFMSRLNKSWQNANLGSLHGRNDEFLKITSSNNISIWLTDKKNSPSNLAQMLFDNNFNYKMYVGENLSYDDEKITIGFPKEIKEKLFSNLCVVVVENL